MINWNSEVFWFTFSTVISGLFLTSIFRYFYRWYYPREKSLIKLFLVIVVCSFLLTFFWIMLRDGITLIANLILDIDYPYHSIHDISLPIWTIIGQLLFMTWPLFVWSILYFGLKLWFDLNEEKEKLNQAIILGKEAQLQMLRYQINPHFLFNTLNSIQALMFKDVAYADRMLNEFSEFLRFTLKHNDKTYIPIDQEIEIVSKYLLIEKIRFEDKLDYKIEVGMGLNSIEILCFLIQPFVENAIKHGFCCEAGRLSINIDVQRVNRSLYIRVYNTGELKNKETGAKTGINNVRRRLENAYPENHKLSIHEDNKWVKVDLEILNQFQ